MLATFLVVATLPATSGAVTSVTSGNIVTDTYGYTGATETLTIPSDVTSISLTMVGAEGGQGGRDASGTAPPGGYQGEVTGTLAVTPGQVLTIAVGQGGANSPVWNTCTTGSNYALGDPLDAVGGLNPLGYDGGNGGSAGPSGCSGYGGSGGGASVVEVGTTSAPTSAAVLVAGGSGGSGGSGQFSPTLGQISLPTYQARPDLTSTTGQYGESVYTACHQVTGQQCDGGGGAGGGGGAQGGSAGLVEFGSGTSDEWFGLGGYPGENDTNSLPGLSSQYVYYANDNANGSVVISYSTGVPATPTAVYGSPGNASASLYWSAPSSSGSIPAPSGYVVQYSTSPYSSWTTASSCTGTTTTCTVTGLTNGTPYEFEVAAVNTNGQGQFSAPSSSVTPSGPPGAPNISGIIPSDGSLMVSFSGASSSLPISTYQYSLDGGATWNPGGVTTSPMTIAGLTNGTTYSVEIRAVNAVGNGAASAPVPATPSVFPGEPTITSITPGGDGTSLSVTFVPGYPGGSPITGYDYATSLGANTTAFGAWTAVGGTTSPFVITGLSSGSTYSVELRAINANGPGEGSPFANGVTLAVPDRPTITSVTSGNSSLQVSYTPYSSANDGGSPISGIDYSLDGGTTWTSAGTLADPFTIAALSNGTTYGVLLRADNGVGSSTVSSPVNGTPRTLPSAPTQVQALSAPGAAQVSWSPPVTTGGAPITGYTASAFTATSGGSAIASCTSATTSCQISGLSNDVNYFIEVVATNVAGPGPASSPRVSALPAALPGAPTISTLTAGNSYLAVPFTAGTFDTNAPITGYQYSTDGGITWMNASGTSSPIVISGLNNGTTYTVELQAVSAIGPGAASNSEIGTPYAAPDPTANATTSYTAGSQQVTVHWLAPNNNGAAISSYTVTAFTAAISGSPASTCTTATLSCTLTGLTNGTTYYISIQSVNVFTQYSLRSTPRIPIVPGTPSTTTLTANPTSSSYGTSVTLSAAITSGATGTVAFSVNGSGISGCSAVTVTSNSAQCVTSALPAGSDNLLASYSGDPSHAASSGTDSFNVGSANQTALTLTTTSTNYTPSPGNTVNLATSGGTTGAGVTFVVSPSANSAGCSVSGSTLTYSSSGSCQVTATMAGNANYNAVSSSAITFNVGNANQAALTLTTTSATYTASPGNTVNLATSGGTTGAGVTYVVSPSANSAGCSISGTTMTYSSSGSCQVTATMAGNVNYNAVSSSATTFKVALADQAALTLTTTSTNFTPSPGNTVALTTSGGTAGAVVTYVVAPSANSAGCSVSGSTLTYTSSGSCQITSTMAGNANYAAVSSPGTTFNVNSISSITTLTANPTSSTYGTSVTLNAAITSGATGTVAFSVNGSSISGCSAVAVTSGSAQCVTAALPTGSDTLRASYSGDVNHNPSMTGYLVFGVASNFPAAPHNVSAQVNGTSATVSWSPPTTSGTSSIVKYVVTASPGGASCTTTGATHCVVSGLQADVAYTFSVVAFNRQGASHPGNSHVKISKAPLTAPRAPAVSITNRIAHVSWTSPVSHGATPITRYVVTAMPGGARCTTSGVTHCAVSGLQTGTTYTFLVVAFNRHDESPKTSTSGAVLTLPTVAVNAGVAVASWQAQTLVDTASARYRVSMIPGTFDCATVKVTTCTLVGIPTVKRYQVTLELLDATGRVVSVVTGTVREVVLVEAYFNLGSFVLSPAMQARITNLAHEMVKNHMSALTIYGHADSSGSPVANLALSRERAQAVASFLYEHLRLLGDTSVRLHVVGGGISTASMLYSLDRNAIVVTSTNQVIALYRVAS